MTGHRKYDAQEVINQIARRAEVMAFQAGVGGMETAGQIVAHLAKHPENLEPFMVGGLMELPVDYFVQHDLTYYARNGKIVHPEYARRQGMINRMKKVKADG